MALRYDIARFDKVERTPQGGLRVAANLTRTGVFTYRNQDGSETRELRHPDDVFAADSLASFRQAPLTVGHPPQPVDPSNWKQLAVGHVGDDVRRDGSHVAATIAVQDADAVRKVLDGSLVELSPGYSVDVVPGVGVYEGQKYDARQTNIRANHVASGGEGWGRGGSSVSFRLDAGDAVMVEERPAPREGKDMKIVRIDGVDYEFGSDAHVAKLMGQHTAELAAEKKRADDAAAELVKRTDSKAINAAVKYRAIVLDTHRYARKFFKGQRTDEEETTDATAAEGSDNTDLIAEVVKMCDPDFDAAGKSPDFIAGAFSVSIGLLKKMTGGSASPDASSDANMEPQTSMDEPAGGGDAPTYPRDSAGALRGDALYAARAGRAPQHADGSDRFQRAAMTPEERMRHDNREAYKLPLHTSRGV